MNYNERTLKAFINSDSFPWYADTFEDFSESDNTYPIWKWSWWAFFGGVWFLFYRKLYLEGFLFWLFGIIFTYFLGPLVMIPLMICIGGFSPWILYKRYLKIKREVEYTTSDNQERLFLMKDLGGYNKWIIPILILLIIFTLLI